ncbi:hypothetical protein FB451DRAFT_1223602 [Mycena latifolia]|nr:hypothetical protein FB451DRAFT_1223602 [Mycena latifolia]
MRAVSAITTIFLAASVAMATIIPKELGELATRGDPDKLAILGALNSFLVDFSYPNYVTVAQNITYSGFSDSIVGRLDLTQEYVGNELNLEYIFGFAAAVSQLNTTPVIGYPKNLTVFALSIDAPVAIVTTLTYYDWKGTVGAYPVQIDTWFKFDDDLKIIGYDIGTRRFAWLYETITPLLGKSIAKELGIVGSDDRLIQTRAALDICAIHDEYCTGTNVQYKTHAECMDTLLNKKPLGKVWTMGLDTTWVHFGMVKYRPSVHCPHIGPTDRTYTAATLNNPFPFAFVA